MLRLKQAIIVEGKYDKIKLESVVDAVILTTEGFGIYKDREKLSLIRAFAERDGIVILTDSDAAGFQIRNFLRGSIPNGKIYHAYIPDVFGKETRKEKPSKEGKLGVEGFSPEALARALGEAGIGSESAPAVPAPWLSLADLMDDGLCGGSGSNALRKALLKQLGLPERLSTKGLLEVLNRLYEPEEYRAALACIKNKAPV